MKYQNKTIFVEAYQADNIQTILTPLGRKKTAHGDWVITKEDGEKYILDNETFRQLYEEAKD